MQEFVVLRQWLFLRQPFIPALFWQSRTQTHSKSLVFNMVFDVLDKTLSQEKESRYYWASLVLSSKESACNAGNPGLIPGLRGSPKGGNGNPL